MRVCDKCQCYLSDGDEASIKVTSRIRTKLGIVSNYSTLDYELCDRCVEEVHSKINAFIFPKSEMKDNNEE